MKKPEYQTVSFAGITLSASAQQAIYLIQDDLCKVVCENLDRVALRLCEDGYASTSFEVLNLVASVLKARDLVYKIGETESETGPE
ncbi:MAG: hypothetical protein LBL24_11080 [Bacteroidales bacterium]|jgi:hypothetical protein|nr:hypothetical protein [Bacteroidales bacterium]